MSILDETGTQVIKTDVLILGGGIAGALAATKARESGLDVVLVDKGNIGRSGLSHQMSGSCTMYDPNRHDYDEFYGECVEGSQWLSDQSRLEGMIEETATLWRDLEGWGVRFQKEKGDFIFFAGVGHSTPRNIIMVNGGFQLMSIVRGEVLRRGVRVIERVMSTGLLTSDGNLPTGGTVVGAVGFDVRRGKFYVFKAKSTVIATGSASSFPGLQMRIYSLSGDGNAMAFTAGCEMRNMDLSTYSDTPAGFNCAPGSNILFGEGVRLINAKGERFMQKWDPIRMERATRAVRARAITFEDLEGRGPICVDATQLDEAAHHRIEMAIPIIVKNYEIAGLSLRKDRIPYTAGIMTHGPGGVRVAEDGATTVAGLYCGGAASDHGEDGVSNIIEHGTEAAIGGLRAGAAAAQYAKEAQEPVINEKQIQQLKEQIFAPMARSRGLKHQVIEQHCARICENGLLGPIRNETRLKEAIVAAGVIRESELPQLVANDYHELAGSIGAGNALLLLELLPRCALLRKESRGSHYREDFPERDDANWLKWVIAKKEGNDIKVWAEPVPFEHYPLKPHVTK